MILAVTHGGDDHAAPVLAALARRGIRAALLDLALVPRQGAVALAAGGGAAAGLTLPSGETVSPEEIRAVWWRRPQAPLPADGLTWAESQHARRQWEAALHGLVAGLACPLVNDPWREARASHKPAQLAHAARAGLEVPRTLVTSDPAAAAAFLDGPGGLAGAPAVAKPLDGLDPTGWTRLVGPSERDRLGALPLAPVVLQACVPGVDVRVTAVGGRLHACEIDARGTSSPHDFRPVFDEARVAPCQVPAAVAAGVRRLLDGLGLTYAALDFRVREGDGAWLFLEANPSGQWLGFEARAGLPITEAVAALLAGEPA